VIRQKTTDLDRHSQLLGLWRTERCSAINQRSVLNRAAWCRTLAFPLHGDLDHAMTFTGGPVGWRIEILLPDVSQPAGL
jgi:hypothetical protein